MVVMTVKVDITVKAVFARFLEYRRVDILFLAPNLGESIGLFSATLLFNDQGYSRFSISCTNTTPRIWTETALTPTKLHFASEESGNRRVFTAIMRKSKDITRASVTVWKHGYVAHWRWCHLRHKDNKNLRNPSRARSRKRAMAELAADEHLMRSW